MLNRPVVTVAPPGRGTALTAAAKAGSAIGKALGRAAAALAAGAAVDFVARTLEDVDVADVDVFDEVAEFPQATSSTAVGTRSAAKIRFIRESNQTDWSHSRGYPTFASAAITRQVRVVYDTLNAVRDVFL
ncbi:hypothetical protein AWH04_03200 [Rhodococcus erythropolis]|nr:hypothetical protein AWH04_03200 [Rhodococcus erythropolis]